MLHRNSYKQFSEIVEYIRNSGDEGDDFCLYGGGSDVLNSTDEYYISDYPDVINDKQILPASVMALGLSYVYSGQQFSDVISLVFEQKPDASFEDCARALNYYQDHDEFLDF